MNQTLENLKATLNSLAGYGVIYKYDKTMERIYFTENLPHDLGYAPEEYALFAATPSMDLVYEPDRKLISDIIIKAEKEKNNEISLMFRMKRKDGSLIWIRDWIRYFGNVDGKNIYVAHIYDITSEWESRNAILERTERAVAAFDKYTKTVLYGNKRFFEYAHMAPDKCLGEPCYKVICKMGSWNADRCVCFKSLDISEGIEYYDEDQKKYFNIMANETKWGEHEAIIFYIKDVTLEASRKKELADKNAQVQALQSEALRIYKRQINTIMQVSPDALSTCQINITRNTCTNAVSRFPNLLKLQRGGTVDSYFADAREFMDPDQYDKNVPKFKRENLVKAFEQGHAMVSSVTRYKLDRDYERIINTIVNMTENPLTHDIEGIIYTLDITDSTMNRAIMSEVFNKQYEAAAVIDVTNNTYMLLHFMYSENINVDRKKVDYTNGLDRLIASYVAPVDKRMYAQKAALDTIVRELNSSPGYNFLARYMINAQERLKKISYHYLGSDKKTILTFVEDVTDITQKERQRVDELRQALREADEAREAKALFFSNISHDMRTPLNGVLGFTALGKASTSIEEKNDCLDKIETSGRFLLHLINDTLDMSKMESKHLKLECSSLSMNTLINEVANAVSQTAKAKEIELSKVAPSGADQFVWGDRMRIQQICINLLGNAIKFTPAGGKVELKAELFRDREDDCNYCISIKDNGVGMKPEFLPHAFEAFSQQGGPVTQNTVGTGLGLAIVKQLVDLMHGHIEVQSQEGKGTEFKVYLPLPFVEGEIKETPVHVSSVVELAGKRILLCEDHPINRELVLRLLSKRQIKVDCAQDGLIGVEKFKNSRPFFYDAILMDVRMPNLNGLEATAQIRQLAREDAKTVPIIAMTANAFPEDRQRGEAAGMNAYIVKPIIPEDVFTVLQQYIK